MPPDLMSFTYLECAIIFSKRLKYFVDLNIQINIFWDQTNPLFLWFHVVQLLINKAGEYLQSYSYFLDWCGPFFFPVPSHLSNVEFSWERSLSITGWIPNMRNSYRRWIRNSKLVYMWKKRRKKRIDMQKKMDANNVLKSFLNEWQRAMRTF